MERLVADLLREEYSLGGELTRLDGDVDLNWRLDGTDGRRYLVKAAAPEHTRDLRAATELIQALERLAPELPVERVTPDKRGDAVFLAGEGAALAAVRVTTFLSGVGLRSLTGPSEQLMRDLGEKLAQLDASLANVSPVPLMGSHEWELYALSGLDTAPVSAVDSELGRKLRRFCDEEWPVLREQLADLPTQLIHNDLDGDNVLVHEHSVSGILDFGDASIGPRIIDLAVTAAFVAARWEKPSITRALIDGYARTSQLSDYERHLLGPLVKARQALRTINAFAGAQSQPQNADYRLRNAAQAGTAFSTHDRTFSKGKLW